MKSIIALCVLALAGCKKDAPQPEPMASASAPAASSAAKAPDIAPSALPVCAAGDAGIDPLAAFCAIGADSSRAHFECQEPEPTQFCGKLDTWSCRYYSLMGHDPPRTTFEAHFDHVGAPLKEHEIIDTKTLLARFPRTGPVRGVAVHTHVEDDNEGKRLAADTKWTIEKKWGCVSRDDEHLDCGKWNVHVHYLDINNIVYVEAGEPGVFDCH